MLPTLNCPLSEQVSLWVCSSRKGRCSSRWFLSMPSPFGRPMQCPNHVTPIKIRIALLVHVMAPILGLPRGPGIGPQRGGRNCMSSHHEVPASVLSDAWQENGGRLHAVQVLARACPASEGCARRRAAFWDDARNGRLKNRNGRLDPRNSRLHPRNGRFNPRKGRLNPRNGKSNPGTADLIPRAQEFILGTADLIPGWAVSIP